MAVCNLQPLPDSRSLSLVRRPGAEGVIGILLHHVSQDTCLSALPNQRAVSGNNPPPFSSRATSSLWIRHLLEYSTFSA